MAGNREYKSDVFSMLMEDKSNALQLYNAVNGSDYKDPEMLEIRTMDKGISLTVRNDAAFVLDMSLSIYEHQSTVCPNMPIRELVYFTYILERMIKNRNIFGRSLVRIPIPRFAVFYNGDENQPDQYEMRLSDAFERPVEHPEIELICKVYNINFGHNQELLDKCPVLKEYMTFVDYVRMFFKENDHENLEDAIERAIDRCIEENVLRDFLIEHRSEVVKVTQMDYTFDRQIMLEREEAREEGREEGHKAGREEGRKEGRKEGREEERTAGIQNLVELVKELNQSKEICLEKLKEKYQLKDEQAENYVREYWK
jgi:hypothetical protein